MQVIGHRGAKGEAPENTLFGFEYLKSLGIQNVEFDIRVSNDLELIIIHDESVDRTTDHKGLVAELKSELLYNLDACSKVLERSEFNSQETCSSASLNEGKIYEQSKHNSLCKLISLPVGLKAFDALQHAQIEVKPPRPEHFELICEKITRTIKSLNIEKVCVITSSDLDFLDYCKDHLSTLQRGIILEQPTEKEPLLLAEKLACNFLILHWKLCTEELIAEAHQKKISVSAWTVNDEDTFNRLYSWNIDSIITDYPSNFLSFQTS